MAGTYPPGNGRPCAVLERRADLQFYWPVASGELQAPAKLRPVDRVSGSQFVRSLRRSRVRAEYRARGARPVSCGRVHRPPGADGRRATNAAAALATEWRRGRPLARWPAAIGGELRADRRAARPLVRGAGCRGARRARSSPMHWHALSPLALSARQARGARAAGRRGECGSRTRPPGRAAGPPTRRRRRRLVAVRGAAQPACRPCLLVHVRRRLLSPAVLGSLACSGESGGRWGAPRDSRGAPVSLSFRRVKLWCHSAARAP